METHIVEDEISSGEHSGHAWLQGWENELVPYAGVTDEHQNELRSLVEDKEIAARAVAFVVNSTRKGIVPLCADVASLLRAKRSLEKKVSMLKKENELLRSSSSISRNSSHSISPTPNSQSSDKSTQPEFILSSPQERRPCSRCSQCSSTISNSPKFDKYPRQRLTSLQYSPASSQDGEQSRRHSSPHGKRSRSNNRGAPDVRLTHAIVHVNPQQLYDEMECDVTTKGTTNESSATVKKENTEDSQSKSIKSEAKFDRTKAKFEKDLPDSKRVYGRGRSSLEETVSAKLHPYGEISEITDPSLLREKKQFNVKSKCSMDEQARSVTISSVSSDSKEERVTAEFAFDGKEEDVTVVKYSKCKDIDHNEVFLPNEATVKTEKDQSTNTYVSNDRLSPHLAVSAKRVEDLRERLSTLEVDQTNHLFIENECDIRKKDRTESKMKVINNNNNIKNINYEHKPKNSKRITPISAFRPHFIHDCKCTSCLESKEIRNGNSGVRKEDTGSEKRKFSVSHKLQIQLDDHVVAKGDKAGFVRYIGHLDHSSQSHMVYVGLELDNQVGSHDGCLHGKRYFSCHEKYGIFVPLQEVMCKVTKKVSKPQNTKEENGNSVKKKRHSPDKSIKRM